jgi:hypothetical protein
MTYHNLVSSHSETCQFFIGWDVGGWNCDHNSASRDALVILDADLAIVGTPWRGNLRESINAASDAHAWLTSLFELCQATPTDALHCTLGVDTPLGFSDDFVRLITRQGDAGPVGGSESNAYLYRHTEQFLFAHGLKPLSPVKDMIGSQATKGMHVLARFAPNALECGAWGDTASLAVLEAYPSPCKHSAHMQAMLQTYAPTQGAGRHWPAHLDHQDKRDALLCALLAHLFACARQHLASPPANIPASEGWIWVPQDALR